VSIGPNLTPPIRNKLYSLLRNNTDVFAWTLADMTGVPRHISEHSLDVDPTIHPFVQKKRNLKTRNEAACAEVQKLVQADILIEVRYHI
jgi:hypothetical protein